MSTKFKDYRHLIRPLDSNTNDNPYRLHLPTADLSKCKPPSRIASQQIPTIAPLLPTSSAAIGTLTKMPLRFNGWKESAPQKITKQNKSNSPHKQFMKTLTSRQSNCTPIMHIAQSSSKKHLTHRNTSTSQSSTQNHFRQSSTPLSLLMNTINTNNVSSTSSSNAKVTDICTKQMIPLKDLLIPRKQPKTTSTVTTTPTVSRNSANPPFLNDKLQYKKDRRTPSLASARIQTNKQKYLPVNQTNEYQLEQKLTKRGETPVRYVAGSIFEQDEASTSYLISKDPIAIKTSTPFYASPSSSESTSPPLNSVQSLCQQSQQSRQNMSPPAPTKSTSTNSDVTTTRQISNRRNSSINIAYDIAMMSITQLNGTKRGKSTASDMMKHRIQRQKQFMSENKNKAHDDFIESFSLLNPLVGLPYHSS